MPTPSSITALLQAQQHYRTAAAQDRQTAHAYRPVDASKEQRRTAQQRKKIDPASQHTHRQSMMTCNRYSK